MAVTHVFVTPRKTEVYDGDRKVPHLVPVHGAHAAGAGASGVLLCEEGKVYRVAYSTETRKRINATDFALCDRDGKEVDELAKASAPNEVTLDDTGAVTPTPIVAGPAVEAFEKKFDAKEGK